MPACVSPLPSSAYAGKFRSSVPAPTVMIHGAVFTRDDGFGPLFPAEHETTMPRRVAASAPTAMGSRESGNAPPPSESERTSTPSSMACSMPARMSELKHPCLQHTLYAATRAPGAMPRAVPDAYPRRLASATTAPAAVDAVCVPCPSRSRGDVTPELTREPFPPPASWPRKKARAPMSLRLHIEEGKSVALVSQLPCHRAGTGPRPASPKLGLSGQTPVSSTPMMTSEPPLPSASAALYGGRWRKEGERVVWSGRRTSSWTDATAECPRSAATWDGRRRAANADGAAVVYEYRRWRDGSKERESRCAWCQWRCVA
uniref:Uncharacterized protein n=1 Tax=Arundo donax TaxID=35708 RepID=A0A0A9EXJ6_ARUDO